MPETAAVPHVPAPVNAIRLVTWGGDTWLVVGCAMFRQSDVACVMWRPPATVDVMLHTGVVTSNVMGLTQADVDACIATATNK